MASFIEPLNQSLGRKTKAKIVRLHQARIFGSQSVVGPTAHPFRLIRESIHIVRGDEAGLAELGADLLRLVSGALPPLIVLRMIGKAPAFPAIKPPSTVEDIARTPATRTFKAQTLTAEICRRIAVGDMLEDVLAVAGKPELRMIVEGVEANAAAWFTSGIP
jgi:hypothetical protein